MKILGISLVLVFGICIGALISQHFNQDTGLRCMQMYDIPEDQSECVWLLNEDDL
jgi:hypothetical protein